MKNIFFIFVLVLIIIVPADGKGNFDTNLICKYNKNKTYFFYLDAKKSILVRLHANKEERFNIYLKNHQSINANFKISKNEIINFTVNRVTLESTFDIETNGIIGDTFHGKCELVKNQI